MSIEADDKLERKITVNASGNRKMPPADPHQLAFLLTDAFYRSVSNLINYKALKYAEQGKPNYAAQGMLEDLIKVLQHCNKNDERKGHPPLPVYRTTLEALNAWRTEQNAHNKRCGNPRITKEFMEDIRELLILCQAFFLSGSLMGDPSINLTTMIEKFELAV